MRKLIPALITKKYPVRTLGSVLGVVIIVLAMGGFMATRHIAKQRSITQQQQQAQTAASKRLAQSKDVNEELQKQKEQAAPQSTKTDTPPSTPSATATAKNSPVKYSTSSDPRSTSYSLTPVVNPATYKTQITHMGQVAAGTQIAYNASKGDKQFYGGDLNINPSTLTISRSGSHEATVTISAPDGRVIGMAGSPWDDTSPYMGAGMDLAAYQSTGGKGVSLPILINMFVVPANGTYTLHISTGPINPPTSDGWQYDGFITVTVVD